MSKPSIFSQDYSDSMKKRRRKIVLSVIVILVMVCGGAFYISKNTTIKDVRENVKKIASSLKDEEPNEKNTEEEKNTKANVEEEKIATKENADDESNNTKTKEKNDTEDNEAAVNDEIGKEMPEENTEKIDAEEKEYIGLGRETMVTINYKVKDGKKEVISLGENEGVAWDILNNNIVVNVIASANTYIIKEDFTVVNITKEKYISTKKRVYTKEYVTNLYKGYIWGKEPKFLDDNTIVYISYLPYISDKKVQYLWRYNIKEETHTPYYYTMPNSKYKVLGGNEVIIGKIENEKINIQADKVNYYVDRDGNVINN